MVKVEGKSCEKPIYILIELGASLSYLSPSIVDCCTLERKKHHKSWFVQLAMSTKRRITSIVPCCLLNMKGMETRTKLNILQLGSYDILIGMDLLESQKTIINCFNKTFT